PVASTISIVRPLMVPCVPTGIKAGSATSPCGVPSVAGRAPQRASTCSSSKRSEPVRTITAQLKVVLRDLLAHFVQARDAEVLALQKVIARFANEIAERIEAQASHALAGANREVEVRDRPLEQRLLVGRHRRVIDRRLGLGFLVRE